MKRLALLIALLVATIPVAVMAESAKGEIKPAPWSGEWWSRKKGFLIKGWPGHSSSPFEKYDSYVESRTGKKSGAVAWESNLKNNHYNPSAENWEGHCNGWAAAAILALEPKKNQICNGIEFTVADQKGLLSEQYMNTYCKFYGKRNWGKPDDDYNDIYPDEFHRILMEYIASGKSALIVDTSADRMVWNYPLYKFESKWSAGWFNDKKLKVTTICYLVNNNVKPEYLGTKWFSLKYTYDLYVDDAGNVVSGEWTGDSRKNHPDFIWVPTADAPNPKNSNLENPKIEPKFVKEIVENRDTTGHRDNSSFRSPDAAMMEAGLDPSDLF